MSGRNATRVSIFTLLLGVTATGAGSISAQSTVKVVNEIPLLFLDQAGSGEVWLLLRNEGDKEAQYTLTLGTFLRPNSKQQVGARPTFFRGTDTAGLPYMEALLAAGATQRLRMRVTNFPEGGEAEAQLKLNSTNYPVRAIRYDVPFNVSIQSPIPDKPRIELKRGKGGVILLKNDDALTYPIVWRLMMPDEPDVFRGSAMLPPKSTVHIAIQPKSSWFEHWFEGFFKPDERKGVLSLQMGDTLANGPVKTMSVDLALAFYSRGWMAFVGSLIVLVLLLGGGGTSLLAGLWIPNKRTRNRLFSRLQEVENKTRAISSDTPSALRVGVRVERLRIEEMLKGLNALFPDSTERMNQLEKQIDTLASRVTLADELDEVSRKLVTLRARTAGVPPTKLKEATRALEDATRVLCQDAPTDADLQAARTTIREADARIEPTDQEDAEFAKRLATRVKRLRQDYANTSRRKTFRKLHRQIGELLEVIEDPSLEEPVNITPDKYFWVDTTTQRLSILQHYIIFRDGAGAGVKELIEKREDRLLKHLCLRSTDALDVADRIEQEMRENVFSENVKDQILQGSFRVRRDPMTVSSNTPVRLEVELLDAGLRGRTALRDVRCIWTFAKNVGEEQGWEIVHYFRNKEEAEYSVHFQTLDGQDIKDANGQRIGIKNEKVPLQVPPEDERRERFTVELLQLGLALGLAVIALVAGAREQILKLDILPGLITVFMLGFGADQVKNIFARR